MKQNPDATETAFMARQLVQCTLPHSDPGDTPIWTRTNGNLTLVIQPHIDRQTRKAMYPYGSIPRLFLFWLVTEAKRKKSRHIRLGNILDNFMREIGLNPRTGGGKRGDAKRLQEQMRRLIDARISFESETETHGRYLHMDVNQRRWRFIGGDPRFGVAQIALAGAAGMAAARVGLWVVVVAFLLYAGSVV